MKTAFGFLVAGGLLLAGCGDNNPVPPTPPSANIPVKPDSGNPLNAPTDYLGGLGKAQQSAVKTIDTAAINNALSMFHDTEGRYPATLDELVTKQYLRVLPKPPYGMKFAYDAVAGTVKVVKQ